MPVLTFILKCVHVSKYETLSLEVLKLSLDFLKKYSLIRQILYGCLISMHLTQVSNDFK